MQPQNQNQEPRPHVFIACPGYGSAHPGSVRAAFVFHSQKHRPCYVAEQNCSLLAFNFNTLFCKALCERRNHPLRYFLMLHSDIEPQPWWVDVLIDELERHNADVLSAVVPMKSEDGLCSCGIGKPGEDFSAYYRLSMRQLELLPETFGAADLGFADWPLLINTGCWVMRLDRPWVDEFPGFTINDRIRRAADGSACADVEPEDWNFSRWCWSKGLKVLATKKVRLLHHGANAFSNQGVWGSRAVDHEAQGPIPEHMVPPEARPRVPAGLVEVA